MTGEWAAPCDWPEPDQLERDLAAADVRAFLDLHGPPPRPPTGFDADPWHGYARPATGPRRRFNPYRGIHDVETGGYL